MGCGASTTTLSAAQGRHRIGNAYLHSSQPNTHPHPATSSSIPARPTKHSPELSFLQRNLLRRRVSVGEGATAGGGPGSSTGVDAHRSGSPSRSNNTNSSLTKPGRRDNSNSNSNSNSNHSRGEEVVQALLRGFQSVAPTAGTENGSVVESVCSEDELQPAWEAEVVEPCDSALLAGMAMHGQTSLSSGYSHRQDIPSPKPVVVHTRPPQPAPMTRQGSWIRLDRSESTVGRSSSSSAPPPSAELNIRNLTLFNRQFLDHQGIPPCHCQRPVRNWDDICIKCYISDWIDHSMRSMRKWYREREMARATAALSTQAPTSLH